ncbi:MAG: dTMP kinase [Phototrophicales bacterium]|nr:MAG: dTMP kinase [Phototrophicales bacterium]
MFISFEGLDGSGKTTQVKLLFEFLQKAGYSVLVTREPGGTPIGEAIRDVLHDMKHAEMHPRTELLLYVASRAQLVSQVIRPHLAQGNIVISDRFADSTLAYQGYGHGLPLEPLRQIINFATDGLWPDLTLFLDTDPQVGLQRRYDAAREGQEYNRLDDKDLAFYQRVYAGYQALMQADPNRWKQVNANDDPNTIANKIREVVLSQLKPT